MDDKKDFLKELHARLEFLVLRQESLAKEIDGIKKEVRELGAEDLTKESSLPKFPEEETVQQHEVIEEPALTTSPAHERDYVEPPRNFTKKTFRTSNIEKFIGENLINKIGIIIVIIGAVIGGKYAIDHDLVSPLVRISLGYLLGATLLVVALRLRSTFENFSAVLLSGAMSIFYFITYFAFELYEMIPQLAAFVLMVVITIFTVFSAISYNRQIIAHIGLVGAYAVPFLLSEDSGRVIVFFTYISLINLGILAISFRKNWKPLFYSAFAFTWLIYSSWIFSGYDQTRHVAIAFVFLIVFFLILYASILSFKLVKDEIFQTADIVFILLNSFIFYGFGYFILDEFSMDYFLGTFTLLNAFLHFLVVYLIYQKELSDKSLFYFVIGLVITFLTIAIPVQLDGNWVTMLWLAEACLLFWIGRVKGISAYEKLAYPMILLSFFSLLHDWGHYGEYSAYFEEGYIFPVLNIYALTSFLAIMVYSWINYTGTKFPTDLKLFRQLFYNADKYIFGLILVVVSYMSAYLEIQNYWYQLYIDSFLEVYNEHLQIQESIYDPVNLILQKIWLVNYTIIYMGIVLFGIWKYLNNQQSRLTGILLSYFVMLIFLVAGLFGLRELRMAYNEPAFPEYYTYSTILILLRYLSYLLMAVLIGLCYKLVINKETGKLLKRSFDFAFIIFMLVLTSSELLNIMDLNGYFEFNKLGLSVYWGIYSLILIIYGIAKNKQDFRLSAMALFAITLIKLFFYDLTHLTTISKTIVFLSLGITMLVVSFLYNKFKHKIGLEEK